MHEACGALWDSVLTALFNDLAILYNTFGYTAYISDGGIPRIPTRACLIPSHHVLAAPPGGCGEVQQRAALGEWREKLTHFAASEHQQQSATGSKSFICFLPTNSVMGISRV